MWNTIKITLMFIVFFLNLQSAQVDIIQHNRYANFGAGPWRGRSNFWYDINIIRTRDEEILHPHTFKVIHVRKRNNPDFPTFNFISEVETPEGIEIDIIGTNFSFEGGGALTEIESNNSNLSGVFHSISEGAGHVDMSTLLKIPSSTPDMVNEPIRWMNPHLGNTSIGYFNLKTLPDVQVPDFDFGRVIMNNPGTPLEMYRGNKVFIYGGTPNASVRVFLSQSQVDLVCANTDDTLRINFSFDAPITSLDSTGYASSVLEAYLRTDQVGNSGHYTGTVEVQLEYN